LRHSKKKWFRPATFHVARSLQDGQEQHITKWNGFSLTRKALRRVPRSW
jgi:hypothetical protein